MKKLNAFVLLAGSVCGLASAVRADVVANNDCLPPTGSAYTSGPGGGFSWGGGIALFLNASLGNFGQCDAPPSLGASTTNTISAVIEGDGVAFGNPLGHAMATANVTIRVTGTSVAPGVRTFDTEMLSLDLTSAGLPGAMIRESPTLASTGRTTITDQGGGLFRIDSFFDVFTELSIDGGATWVPSDGDGSAGPGATRITLGPGVPAPSAAAILAFSGALTLRRRRA